MKTKVCITLLAIMGAILPARTQAGTIYSELAWQRSDKHACVDSFINYTIHYADTIDSFGKDFFDTNMSEKTCDILWNRYSKAAHLVKNLPDFHNDALQDGIRPPILLLLHKHMANGMVLRVHGRPTVVLNAYHPDILSRIRSIILIAHESQHILNGLAGIQDRYFGEIAYDEGLAVSNGMNVIPKPAPQDLLMMSKKNLLLCMDKIHSLDSLKTIWFLNNDATLKEWFVGNDRCISTGCRCGYLLGFCLIDPRHSVCKKISTPEIAGLRDNPYSK